MLSFSTRLHTHGYYMPGGRTDCFLGIWTPYGELSFMLGPTKSLLVTLEASRYHLRWQAVCLSLRVSILVETSLMPNVW